MRRREFLGSLAIAGAAPGAGTTEAPVAGDGPEKKSPTEPLDLEQKMADTISGKRSADPMAYPYFSPDYKLPFTHIGTEKQLFLDNFMLEHMEGMERVLSRPEKLQRPLIPQQTLPWEKTGFDSGVSSLLRDPDDNKYKAWYSQSLSGDLYSTGMVLCYAESTDGLNWEKPLSERCLPYQGQKATNITHGFDVSSASVVLNPDRSDPQRKFLLNYTATLDARKRGLRILSQTAVSPDGLRWKLISDDNDQRRRHGAVIWDPAVRKFLSYSQHSHHWHFGPRMRQIGLQTSEDFVRWSPKRVVLSTEWDPMMDPSVEFHDACVRKSGGLYIATVSQAHTEPLWSSRTKYVRGMFPDTVWRDQFHVNQALYVSRDGRRFQRAHGPEPWVDNGPPGSRDHGFVAGTAADTLYSGGRMIIPYAAIPNKQWSLPREDWELVPESARRKQERDIAEAKKYGLYGEGASRLRRSSGALLLREDGWAMLRPMDGHGQVLTRQFVFEGDRLTINADCNYGDIRVEALDPLFKPYAGFSAEECEPIHNEDPKAVWHTVRWKGSTDVRPLWNKPVILRFHVYEALLFAFRFTYGG